MPDTLSIQIDNIVPVLLSGGSGTRLWPISRQRHPKQFLPIFGNGSLIQQTAGRVSDPHLYHPPIVICAEDQRFLVAEQLRDLGVRATIILESVARSTALPAAVAAVHVARSDPAKVLLLLPADHRIEDQSAFNAAVELAAIAARQGRIVTFGVPPAWPETGYGYILPGDGIPGLPQISDIACFVEKPDHETAVRFIEDGRYCWNSGIFVATAATLIEEIGKLSPATLGAAQDAVSAALRDLDFLRLDQAACVRAPTVSFDVAVMEKTSRASMVRADFSWSDVGSWQSLWSIQPRDEDGNVTVGDVVATDVHNSYLRSDGPLLAAVGVRDVVAIATEDAVLITDRDHVQDVKKIVELLKAQGREEALSHKRVYRPWGYYQCLHSGHRFQVKRLTVKPGAKLSLQSHCHRAEHWVCVSGTALVHIDGTERLLRENESTYIPLGAVHRLSNPGKIELVVIEVQTGAYLDEDDIVRYEDIYARV